MPTRSAPVSPKGSSKDPAILVRQFDSFFSLLSGLADRLRRGSEDAAGARSALLTDFEQQMNALRPLGAGFLSDVAMPARRAMAAMVDQLLGRDLDWPGRAAWAEKPLADQLFGDGDHDATVRRDVEHLLEVDGPSKAQKALARVYLEALGLGLDRPFTGHGGDPGSDHGGRVGDLERRLFALLYPQAPPPETPQLLFPEAYAHNATQGRRSLLPTARPWWIAVAVTVLLLLLISWPVWRSATSQLREALDAGAPSSARSQISSSTSAA